MANPEITPPQNDVPLHLSHLRTTRAAVVLGQAVADTLLERGIVILYLNAADEVETVPYKDLLMDIFPEDQAIQLLSAQGLDDEYVTSYLKGRDVRQRRL